MIRIKLVDFRMAAICLLILPIALGRCENLPDSANKSLAAPDEGKTDGERRAIEKLDDELFAADLKSDAAFFEKNLADNYVRIDSHGEIRNKAETIERYKSGLRKLDALDLTKREVRMFGNIAIVTREDNTKGHIGSSEFSGTYRKTIVYVRDQNGQWLNVNFQSTKVQPR